MIKTVNLIRLIEKKTFDKMKNNDENVLKGKDHWILDSKAKTCYNCEHNFTTFRRRHHCRYCGNIFCNKCLIKKYNLLHEKKIKKICKECLKHFTRQENSGSIKDLIHSSNISTLTQDFQKRSSSVSSTDEYIEESKIFNTPNSIIKVTGRLLQEINSFDAETEAKITEFLNERA